MKNENAWLNKDISYSWNKEENADWIIDGLKIGKKDVVLDIGCGIGAHLEDINKKTKAVGYGVDIREDLFKINTNKRLVLKYADMRELKFQDSYFTKVFSLGAFEHVPETDRVFGEASRVLKKNGMILFTVPNKLSFFHITKRAKQLLGMWKIGYEKSFTINELSKIIGKHNLIIKKAYIVPHIKIHNIFNYLDNKLNRINNERFGFFIIVIARKIG